MAPSTQGELSESSFLHFPPATVVYEQHRPSFSTPNPALNDREPFLEDPAIPELFPPLTHQLRQVL